MSGPIDAPPPGTPERWSNYVLMERIQNGDTVAFDELLRRYWNPLVAYAGRIVMESIAKDVVQEALLRVWADRHRWTPSHQLQAFLYRVVRNTALNENRASRNRQRCTQAATRQESRKVTTPLQDLEHSELRDLIREGLDTLSPRRREIFILIRYHGLSYKETAQLLDIAPQTVANNLSQAIHSLQEFLGPKLADFLPVGLRTQ